MLAILCNLEPCKQKKHSMFKEERILEYKEVFEKMDNG